MKSQGILGEILQNSIRKGGYEKIKDAADMFGLPYETLRKTVSENHIPRDPTLLEYSKFFNIDAGLIIRVAQQSRFERKTGTPLESLGRVGESSADNAKLQSMLAAADAETLISAIESFFNLVIRGTDIEEKIKEYEENKPTKGKIRKWNRENKESATKNSRSALLCFFDAISLAQDDREFIVRLISNMKTIKPNMA